MLAPKPWRFDALLRLYMGVIVCVFVGSVVAGVAEHELRADAARTALYYALSAAAVAAGAITLVLTLRGGEVSPRTARFGWLLAAFFLTLNLAAFAQAAGGTLPQPNSILSIVISTISFQGAALLLTWWFVREHGLGLADAFGLTAQTVPKAIALGAAVACGAFILELGYGQLLELLRIQLPEQHLVKLIKADRSTFDHIYLGLFAIIIAPLAEEMLFRGILYPAIKQLGYKRLALWGTAALFALIHMNLNTFVPLTLLAVGLALLYEKTGTLLAPVVAHSCFNGINFGLLQLGWGMC
ncbi:MAG: CPBP family intramembrane metalloprotease [Verrucomicrobiae bacterium]|nr:CPBP family intramembrane metalloprotease [Verrucomicrobiae bacterium]